MTLSLPLNLLTRGHDHLRHEYIEENRAVHANFPIPVLYDACEGNNTLIAITTIIDDDS